MFYDSVFICLRSAKNKQTKKCRRLVFTDSMYCFLMPSFVVFNDPVFLTLTWFYGSDPRTKDTQWSLFSLKSRTFELGQTNWADKSWGIWCIYGHFFEGVSTHKTTFQMKQILEKSVLCACAKRTEIRLISVLSGLCK